MPFWRYIICRGITERNHTLKIEHPLLKKVNKILFLVIVPLIIAAILLYVFLAPSVVQLNDSYYLTMTERGGVIRVTGGSDVIGPGDVRLNAVYPWVYGVVDDQFFLLNLEENKHDVLTEEELYRKLNSNAIRLPDPASWHEKCYSWHELQESREALKQIKSGISKPAEKKNSLFF